MIACKSVTVVTVSVFFSQGQELLLFNYLPELRGQVDVGHVLGRGEEGGYLTGLEAGNAAAYRRDVEAKLRVTTGVGDELIHVGADGLGTALHRGDGIRLPLKAYTLAHHGTEVEAGHASCSSAMDALEVGTEYKNLVCF